MTDPGLLAAALEGFFLGASLIVAIGAQNAFVLRQGLERRHVLAVASVCALSDTILIAAGVAGLGSLVQSAPWLLAAVTVGGAAFLVTYGLLSLRRAFRRESLRPAADGGAGLAAALLTALALTWLNPHVYLDTVVLIGALWPDTRLREPSPSAAARRWRRSSGSTASATERVSPRRCSPVRRRGKSSTC